jgi:hypothetical protein
MSLTLAHAPAGALSNCATHRDTRGVPDVTLSHILTSVSVENIVIKDARWLSCSLVDIHRRFRRTYMSPGQQITLHDTELNTEAMNSFA